MQHVAALAEALEVARVIVRRVMVEMRGGEHDPGDALRVQFGRGGAGTAPSLPLRQRPGSASSQRPSGRHITPARAAARTPRSGRQRARTGWRGFSSGQSIG